MVYIPPKNLGISGDELNQILTVNDDNIADFMRIFTGFDDRIDAGATQLGYYCSDGIDPIIKDKLNAINIIPYVRAGGSLTSGTASSFVGNTNLRFYPKSELTVRQQSAFNSGSYGTSFGIQQTDEANSRA
ncbi:hypothetical protein FACS1894218_3270 [Bacilli bacterium]|nr:hypothetical protein FACS1894218_3270 [Bacilli bacterium]